MVVVVGGGGSVVVVVVGGGGSVVVVVVGGGGSVVVVVGGGSVVVGGRGAGLDASGVEPVVPSGCSPLSPAPVSGVVVAGSSAGCGPAPSSRSEVLMRSVPTRATAVTRTARTNRSITRLRRSSAGATTHRRSDCISCCLPGAGAVAAALPVVPASGAGCHEPSLRHVRHAAACRLNPRHGRRTVADPRRCARRGPGGLMCPSSAPERVPAAGPRPAGRTVSGPPDRCRVCNLSRAPRARVRRSPAPSRRSACGLCARRGRSVPGSR